MHQQFQIRTGFQTKSNLCTLLVTPLADSTLLSLTISGTAPSTTFDTTILSSYGSPTGTAMPVKTPVVEGGKVYLPPVTR